MSHFTRRTVTVCVDSDTTLTFPIVLKQSRKHCHTFPLRAPKLSFKNTTKTRFFNYRYRFHGAEGQQDAGRAFLWVPYFPWNFQIGTRRAGINRGGAFGGFRSAVNVSNVVAPRKASNSFVLVHPLPMCARSTLAPCVAVCVYLHACTPEARRLVPVHLYVCIRLFVCSCARVYFSNA